MTTETSHKHVRRVSDEEARTTLEAHVRGGTPDVREARYAETVLALSEALTAAITAQKERP